MEASAELQTPTHPTADLTAHETELLARLHHVCNTVLEARAEQVDASGVFPHENLQALADAGLVGVTTPTEWGGQGCSGTFMREYTEILTAACGTTWFIITQHLGSCGSVATSENPRLREQFLRDMATGRHYVGVGFGHLRRPQPMLYATEVAGGWILNGVAPWVTGWPALRGVIFGATLPDKRHLYVYVPAEPSDNLQVGPPQALCAMSASHTVEVALTDLFVPQEAFLRYSSPEAMAQGDRAGIAGAVHPSLGCARGSLRLLQQTAQRRNLAPAQQAADALAREIETCRANARQIADGPKDTPDYEANALAARAWAIELGVRAAHMGVAASSGGANSLDHPAQRRFREAMFYTLTAQTRQIMTATLARLSH